VELQVTYFLQSDDVLMLWQLLAGINSGHNWHLSELIKSVGR